MQKIPMQIYIDQDAVTFYQDYAQRRAISFSEAVREALKDKQESLRRAIIPKKTTHPIVKAIKNAQVALANVPYHHLNKPDDELIYG